MAALSIHHVTHESAAIDAREDSVAVAVLAEVQSAWAETVKEELPQHHANQLRVKLIADP